MEVVRMEIKVVPIIENGSSGSRSKYYSYFVNNFTKEDLEELKQALEQIKGNPVLGVMIDISEVKKLGDRKNKISERGYVDENGQVKPYGTIAKALAAFLLANDIKGVYFTIKEQDDKVYVTFKDISVSRSYRSKVETEVENKVETEVETEVNEATHHA